MATGNFSQDLARVLGEVCAELTTDKFVEEELSPLRKIDRFLWDWQDDQRPKDDDLKFLCFFLETFLEKFFYNFSPEIPLTTPVVEIYQAFINKLKEAFLRMSSYLDDPSHADFYSCYMIMGLSYIEAVDGLNEIL